MLLTVAARVALLRGRWCLMNIAGMGTRFEKYVQGLLQKRGFRVERNIVYHKGGKTRQADLEYLARERLFFSKKVIVECKYVGNSRSLSFDESFDQLGSLVLFAKGDEGLLVTNAIMPKKKEKEADYNISIYDLSDIVNLDLGRYRNSHGSKRIDCNIRMVPYDPEKDHAPVHRYL